MRAAIMAGGKGTRLAPMTLSCPKPLMRIGDKAILELIIAQLCRHGFDQIYLCVGYLAHQIEAYFGNGSTYGVHITYAHETQPLGTVGPLSLVPISVEPLLVINGDVLTTFDFSDFSYHHIRSGADMTVALYNKQLKFDLGVLRTTNDMDVIEWLEKPEFSYQVSMGIYMINPEVHASIGLNTRLDVPDLVSAQIAAGRRVRGYSFNGYWLDIGRPEDYWRACEEWQRVSRTNGQSEPLAQLPMSPANGTVKMEETLVR